MALVFLAAFSMGIQYRCAKQVDRVGVITTMITGTLSSLDSRLVYRDEPMSPDQKKISTTDALETKHESRHPSETTVFLASVWGHTS